MYVMSSILGKYKEVLELEAHLSVEPLYLYKLHLTKTRLYSHRRNKEADQVRGYRAADLCLCFPGCKIQVFSLCCSLNPPQLGSFIGFIWFC